MEYNENVLSHDLSVDEFTRMHLQETARWARFLAIMGFVLSGIIVLVGLIFGSFMPALQTEAIMPFPTSILLIFYVVIGGVYVALSLFLYRFSVKMLSALQVTDQEIFNDSFNNLRKFFKISGIIVIIYLCLMVLVMVASIIFAAMRG